MQPPTSRGVRWWDDHDDADDDDNDDHADDDGDDADDACDGDSDDDDAAAEDDDDKAPDRPQNAPTVHRKTASQTPSAPTPTKGAQPPTCPRLPQESSLQTPPMVF